MQLFLPILNMLYVISEEWLSKTYVNSNLRAGLIMPQINQYCAVHSKRKCGHFSILLRSQRYRHITRYTGENVFMYYRVGINIAQASDVCNSMKKKFILRIHQHIPDDFHSWSQECSTYIITIQLATISNQKKKTEGENRTRSFKTV